MAQGIIVNGALGRMGRTIAGLVQQADDLELVGVVERAEVQDGLSIYDCPSDSDLAQVISQAPGAVVVDFTAPASSVAAAAVCAQTGTPIVMGTTGLTAEQQAELETSAKKAPVFWTPNMSVGVNVLFQMLPKLVAMLGPAYDVEVMEIHHNKKVDSPSGTAVKLGKVLAEAKGWTLEEQGRMCREGIIGARPKEEIGIQTIRGGDVVGDHTIYFLGPGERIEITHRAHSRETFAQGALRAARWIAGQQPGKLYAMVDMLTV